MAEFLAKIFQIRYYQEESVIALYDYFARKSGNPIIALPTGTGKSVVIAEWLRSVFTYFPGQRVMILTHVKELIAQNYRKLVDSWPLAPAGIYSAGLGRKEIRPITFAGIASVVKCAADFGHVDMVIIDECHLVSPHDETSYQNFIADLQKVNPKVKVIGLTATPYRLGQGLLTMPIETKSGPRPSLFSDIAYDLTGLESFNRLIAEGFLCPLIPKRVKEMDVAKVRTVAGEFNLNDLQAAVDREEITRRAFDEVEDQVPQFAHSSGRPRVRWLVFCTGIEHTEHVARELAGRGYQVRAVHSKTGEKARDEAVEWFKEESDDLRIIVNNGVFTTGFDCPQLDVIIVLRPTNSPGLWVQILGRGTRPYPGKDNCLVLDFAGNTKRLGPINDPIIPKRKGMKGGGDAPVKVCEACGCYNHASVRFCTNCGAEFPKAVKFRDTAATDEIIKQSNAPVVEIFPVTHVEYSPYFSRAVNPKPPTLRVTYSCGKLQKFSEWICLEHGGYAEGLARKWWMMSTKQAELRGPPKTVEEALTRLDSLREPTHVRVLMDPKHPRVMDRDFSGSAFGTMKAASAGMP